MQGRKGRGIPLAEGIGDDFRPSRNNGWLAGLMALVSTFQRSCHRFLHHHGPATRISSIHHCNRRKNWSWIHDNSHTHRDLGVDLVFVYRPL